MKAVTRWDYRPFVRFDEPERALWPYICRVAPECGGFAFEWFDKGAPGTGHLLRYRRRGAVEWEVEQQISDPVIKVGGLCDGVDYEFCVLRADGSARSLGRLVRTGKIPGDTVVNYLHPEDPACIHSGYCLCTPTLVRAPSGKLICGMDVYARRGGQNLTLLFESQDNGTTWRYLAELYPCFWPKLFVHRSGLYLLAQTGEYGDLVVGRSYDEGKTWGLPTRLLPGTCLHFGPHHAAVPVGEYYGRLWTSVEYGSWAGGGHDMGYIYADADSDLTDPESWGISRFLRYNPGWEGAPPGAGRGMVAPGGGIEGNVTLDPGGNIVCLYRVDLTKAGGWGKALMLEIDRNNPGRGPVFRRFVDLPVGSNSKFCLQYDDVTKKYIALGSEQSETIKLRKVLSMAVSDDLVDWRVVHRIFDFSHLDEEMTKKVGFQYPDWIFDGDDILLLTRTAFGGAENYHNSNSITFTRIRNFRECIR
jgi:hypothetical protein